MELVGYEDVEARSHEALASLVVHITVDDEVTMEKFGKVSEKTTMGEYRELLLEALEEAPFQVDKVGLI